MHSYTCTANWKWLLTKSNTGGGESVALGSTVTNKTISSIPDDLSRFYADDEKGRARRYGRLGHGLFLKKPRLNCVQC